MHHTEFGEAIIFAAVISGFFKLAVVLFVLSFHQQLAFHYEKKYRLKSKGAMGRSTTEKACPCGPASQVLMGQAKDKHSFAAEPITHGAWK